MPPWGRVLTDKEISELTAFVALWHNEMEGKEPEKFYNIAIGINYRCRRIESLKEKLKKYKT